MTVVKGYGNRKRKCKHCSASKRAHDGIIVNMAFFCDFDCAAKHAGDLRDKKRRDNEVKARRREEEKRKEENKAHRDRKNEVRPVKYHQDKLQKLVNQYVMQVRDKGIPCCTCGNPEANECGHYLSRGSRPELRYELMNLAPQCHTCNVYKSGAKAEYNEYIKERWGDDVFEWLNGPHPQLKDVFSHWTDYEKEINRYRSLLRENGVKPVV